MNLKRVLTKNNVRVNLTGETKEEIITSLVDIIVSAGNLSDKEEILEAVFKREEQMSTGMKNGIGIPHGKTDAVKELHACVAIAGKPVEFNAIDGEPCDIFVMTVSPLSHTGPHLEFLAEVSELLKNEELRNKIRSASSDEELLKILLG